MGELTEEQRKSAMKIPGKLAERYEAAPREGGLVRFVYNEAIDDAANFLRDLATHNPERRLTLEAAERDIRFWLTIPKED